MRNYFIGYDKEGGIRSQPWTTMEGDEDSQYYNLREHPELIRTSLEDLKPWEHHECIQRFYDLLEWLNGPDSIFETNDTALKHELEPNKQKELSTGEYVMVGRMMVFLRDLKKNLSPNVDLKRQRHLNPQVPDFSWGPDTEWLVKRSLAIINTLNTDNLATCLGIELFGARYEELAGTIEKQTGYELSYKFWAWGDDEDEVFRNVGTVVSTLDSMFRQLQEEFLKRK